MRHNYHTCDLCGADLVGKDGHSWWPDYDMPDTIQHGSANFTKGRPFTVTDHDLTINWGGRGRHGFVCGMCDRYFEVGDRARWVYMSKAPNIFVCSSCDGPDVADRFGRRWREVIAPILRQWGKE